MKTKLVKFDVCDRCYGVGNIDPDCMCMHGNYTSINLEFEVCACCGHLISDGEPADTEYNDLQIKNHKFR